MVEITKTTVTFYDFMEMTRAIDKILGYKQRDAGRHFFPGTGDFNDWHDKKGYPQIDSDGKDRGSSQIWFKEYEKDCADDKFKKRPYMDFWHWQMKHCVDDEGRFRNDTYNWVSVSMDCCDEETEDWQREIMQVWHDTFKHLAEDDDDGNEGVINIWVCW